MKTRFHFFLCFFILFTSTQAQIVRLKKIPKETKSNITDTLGFTTEFISLKTNQEEKQSFRFLSGGNIDYLDGGIIQTNAQLMRINIGNPNGFNTPFYICVGANAETTTNDDEPNKSTNTSILSPNGGYLNMGFHGELSPESWKGKKYSQLSFVYQLGIKTISGNDAITDEKINMLSGIGNLGLLFQTQAWNPEDPDNLGMAYLQVVFANTLNNDEKIKKIYGPDVNKHFYGFNIEAGVEITNYINMRLGYYRYLNNKDINDDFKNGIFKISLDFVN